MRRFTLQNARGDNWDMTTLEVIFHDISGLGFSVNPTVVKVGNHWVITNNEVEQGGISGSLHMYSDAESPYEIYKRFAQFSSYTPLILGYAPTDVWYYRKVIVRSLDKTELTHHGALDSGIEFMPLGLWYREEYAEQAEENYVAGTDAWIWRETDGAITWGIRFPRTTSIKNFIDSDSADGGTVRLEIMGPITNPLWTQLVDGVIVDSGQVNVSVPDNAALVIDNRDFPGTITVESLDGSSKTDVYQSSDFARSRFVTLRDGRNEFLITGSDGTTNVNFKMKANILYKTV